MSDYGDPQGGSGFGSADTGSDDPFEGLSEFGKNYIQQHVTDESHRPVVAQHLKKWDQGANAQFQKIHSDYRPYRDLGDLETLQNHVGFVRRFQADPIGTLQLLTQGDNPFLKIEDLRGLLGDSGGAPPSGGEESELEQTLAKLLDKRLGGVTKQQETLAQQLQAFQAQQQENQGRQELDKAINGLKQKYGSDWNDFVENQVLALAANARVPLDQAAEMIMDGLSNYVKAKVPPRAGFSMPGTGSAASFNKKPQDLEGDELKAYIAQRLASQQNR